MIIIFIIEYPKYHKNSIRYSIHEGLTESHGGDSAEGVAGGTRGILSSKSFCSAAEAKSAMFIDELPMMETLFFDPWLVTWKVR